MEALENIAQQAGITALPALRSGIQRVSYTHDGMIDLIIANPIISQNQLAAHFGYTAAWVSRIIASDSFQSRLAERKDELVDPTIKATIEEGFKALVVRSMEILQEKLNKPASSIPDNLALRTLELGTRAAGYGAREGGAPPSSSEGDIEKLAGRLVALQRKVISRPSIEGEAQDVEVLPVAGAPGA